MSSYVVKRKSAIINEGRGYNFMLIGIDASRANRKHRNGAEWYSYHLIRSLAKLDAKNQYLLYSDQPLGKGLADLGAEGALFSEENFFPEIDKYGFQSVKSPHNNFRAKILKWPYKNFWTLGRLSLECLFNCPDVLFIPTHVLPIIHPRRSVVTIHDVGFMKNKSLYRREPIGPESGKKKFFINLCARIFTFGKFGAEARDYLEWSTGYALRKAKKAITVSRCSQSDILENFRVKEGKLSVIYNGFNNGLFKKISDTKSIAAVLNKYGISRPYLFYVGKIEKKKNIPALIEAFAIMRDRNREIRHKLVLVGDAFYGYDEVHYLIREYNLDDEVLMPGWIDEKDMPYVYSGADAFVFPSHYEAFGISLLEAMACGLPIAASDAASIPEVTGDAGLLFDPCDIYAMAEAMKKIICEDSLRVRLASAGEKRSASFSWEKCASETLDVINSL